MSGSWVGPDGHWSNHGRPEARTALDEARRRGWWFRKATGHGFGTVRCQPPEAGPEACSVPIFSTSGASDGSDTAAAIRRAIRRCPHCAEPDEPTSAEDAGALVEKARNCVGLAELLLEAGDQARYAADYLLEAERFADEADRYLALAVEADEASEQAFAEAGALAVATGEDAGGGVSILIDAAVDAVEAASQRLKGERSAYALRLRGAIKGVREDAARLRARMDGANGGRKS